MHTCRCLSECTDLPIAIMMVCAVAIEQASSYYNSSCVCLSVCSPTPPRSVNGSSLNLVGVCRWTSELPLRGSFLKRSTGQWVKRHFFGADDTILRPHRCKRHTASFAEYGVFCPAKGTRRLRVLIPSMGTFTNLLNEDNGNI